MKGRNLRAALHVSAVFATWLAALMLIPALTDLYYGNPDWIVFAISSAVIAALATIIAAATRGIRPAYSTRFAFLLVNCLWLVAFGSALARRFGAVRFLAFSAAGAVAGAAIHLALHFGDMVPVIGASAAISAQMAAAARFVFQTGAPLGAFRAPDDRAYRVPALTLAETVRSPRPMIFVGVWFGINLLVGLGSASIIGGGEVIAWEAHIGGFLAGLFLFRFFDPVPPLARTRAPDRWSA